MAQLNSILVFLDSLLEQNKYQDSSLNGVQVGGWEMPIHNVAYAVDSGLSVIQEAVSNGANLLLVHHGLFWDKPQAITGCLREKLELLIKHKCTIYASHLPLDGNPEVGNGCELARVLGLTDLEGFLEYKGGFIGAKGRIKSTSMDYFSKKLSSIAGAKEPLVLPFGKEKIASVAIVTGSGAFAISSAAKEGIDLFISGEPKQEAYHLAKELKINVIFAGHYATETFGVAALAKKVADKFDVKTLFINEPTGI